MAQVLSLVLLGVMIFAIVDAITADAWRIRYVPKVAWVLLIVFLPLIGSVLWFVLGKERQSAERSVAQPAVSVPRRSATEDQLDIIDREIAFYEKQAEIRRLEAKLEARREGNPNT